MANPLTIEQAGEDAQRVTARETYPFRVVNDERGL